MRIRVQTALQVAATILSIPVAAAELSLKPGELPTGDVWPSEAASQTPSSKANERPATARRDEASSPALPEYKVDIPTEFKFNITLTFRRHDKRPEHHGRSRNPRTGSSRAASLRDLR